jgi:predicted DNA-binding transcriptional regulator YafY
MSDKRIFEVLKILKEKSNKDNKLTINEIISYLSYKNYSSSRNTIKKDIDVLMEAGCNIIKSNCIHNTGCYYYGNNFSIEEIRIILDALYSNKFIKLSKKNEIRGKIVPNISYKDRINLRNCIIAETIDTKGIDINTNLFILHKAIGERRSINFVNTTRNIDNIKKIIEKKDVVKFIPKEIYYYNDRYYLIGINNEDKVRHYRIDRIARINIGVVHSNKEKIELKRYGIKNFDMFNADKVQQVEFKIKKTLINSVIEKFGDEINIHRCFEDKEYFILNISVGVNRGLVRWILKQGADILVIYPKSLIDDVKNEIKKMKKLYE